MGWSTNQNLFLKVTMEVSNNICHIFVNVAYTPCHVSNGNTNSADNGRIGLDSLKSAQVKTRESNCGASHFILPDTNDKDLQGMLERHHSTIGLHII
jgi:hypothetical protein